jgi:hypothetical protein
MRPSRVRRLAPLVAAAWLLSATSLPAQYNRPPPGHPGPGHPGEAHGRAEAIQRHPELAHARWDHHEFHGLDVRLFGAEELGLWRTGLWYQEWHNGLFGWWFFVDGTWYLYDAPVYPYPAVVSQQVYVEPAMPAPVIVAAPPPMAPSLMAPPTAAGAPQFWYYCDASQAYYPYVQTCASQFRPVPVASGPPPR